MTSRAARPAPLLCAHYKRVSRQGSTYIKVELGVTTAQSVASKEPKELLASPADPFASKLGVGRKPTPPRVYVIGDHNRTASPAYLVNQQIHRDVG